MTNTSAKFITIEGIEGVGKSTQMIFVADFLRQHSISVLTTREPGGTPLAEEIRNLVLQPREENVAADTELLLMFASRAQHMDQVILPALNRGEWVVSDRFVDATYAYQGGGRELPLARIDQISDWTLKGFQPNLTLLLDAPVELALARAKSRQLDTDRFEQEKHDFFTRVRSVYLERAKTDPKRIKIIDASKSIEEVQTQIKIALESAVG